MTDLTPGREFRSRSVDGLAVVTPPPQIDLTNADRLRRSLTAAAAEHPVVVVDMTANELCDSSGVRALVVAHQRARASGGEIRLVMSGPAARRLFKLTGVDRVLPIFDSMPAAVAV
jgi:anti-sigma B factor antagonist